MSLCLEVKLQKYGKYLKYAKKQQKKHEMIFLQ